MTLKSAMWCSWNASSPAATEGGGGHRATARCCCCGGAVCVGRWRMQAEELSHVTKPSRSAHRACMKKGLCSSLLLLFFVQTLLLKGQAVLKPIPLGLVVTLPARYFFGERILLPFCVSNRSCTANPRQCNVCKMHKQFHTQKNCYKCVSY